MAASRSDHQLAEIGLFVKALYEIGGYATWKEFADEAKISTGQVSEFQTGTAEPSGYNLLRLIQVAALRADAAAATVAVQASGRTPLEDIRAGVASILESQAELLAALEEGRSREAPVQKRTVRRRKAAQKKEPA